MNTHAYGLLIGLGLLVAASGARGAPPAATQPGAEDNGWNWKLFDFSHPPKLIVEESTPTAGQITWLGRPAQLAADAPDPVAAGAATPREVGPLNIVRLTFKDADGEIVPALLCTPKGKTGPFPVVIAIHGLTSNKAQVCAQVGPSLAKHGFAVLALDLPRHGERPGEPLSVMNHADPAKSFELARRAINDVRQLIDLAETRPELDTKGGVTLAGYSLGSWISSIVGPLDPRVKQMVLMVGGATELPPAVMLIPQVMATDPRLAIAHFAGRPVLMLNGKTDQIVKPDWAKRLFAAAPEPKSQVWYDSGHFLPAAAYEDAATWIAEKVGKGGKGQGGAEGEQGKRRAG